ncbi:MAG: hypothetical protein KGL95_07010, partial [Patescibacteria group bacterium]|nr:hypothetical protein [Patescibacteria group bacterium]
QGLQLIFKREDGSPACIKPDTAQKLVQRGWASEIVSSTQIINLDWGNNTLTLGDVRYDTVSFPPDIKQTIDLDGISFTYTGNGSVTRGDCYGTWVNQTEAKSFSVTADNEFNENPYQCWPPSDYPPQIMENGKPVNILLLRYSFSFFDINQTAGVAWCNSDICPMGKALYLVKYGWNFPVTYDSPSLLQFYFNTNSSVIRIGQAIGIDIGDNNTQPRSIRVPFSYNYSFSSSSLFPCDYGPFRVAAFEGYVTKENLNTTEPLHFYQPGDYTCQAPAPGKFWIFHSMNNTATLVCHLGVYCNDTLSSRHPSFDGYWDDKGHFRLFDNGNYTIVGGDQWGQLAIRHFTVTNSTTAYTTSISQPTTVQTSDVRGTIKDVTASTPLVELASSSTGIELNRGGCCDLYDHDSIKLVLYHGKRSDSHIIAATVENVGKRTVHIYGILISGFVTITNSTAQYHIVVLRDNQDIMPKEDAILQPGES